MEKIILTYGDLNTSVEIDIMDIASFIASRNISNFRCKVINKDFNNILYSSFNKLQVDKDSKIVTKNNSCIKLNNNEFNTLIYFLENKLILISYKQLHREIYANNKNYCIKRTVSSLAKKLDTISIKLTPKGFRWIE